MTFELSCYRLHVDAVPVAPARPDREIFDRNRHAYRCLPLSVANAAGWELLCPDGFTAEWDGGDSVESLKVYPDNPSEAFFAKSHFAFGVLTMEPGWLFQVSEGYGLWVMGSPNEPKDGIQALTGLVEADWLPYPFSVNWQFTRPGRIRFEKGEPFAFITPTQIAGIAACQPRQLELNENPVLAADVAAWTRDRDEFMARLKARDAEALKTPWRRNYFRGHHPAGAVSEPPKRHFNKLRAKPPLRPESIPAPAAPRQDFTLPPMTWEGIAGDLYFSEDEAAMAPAVVDAGGRLSPSSRTRLITHQADAEALGVDFLLVDELLPAAECDALCAVWQASASHYDQTSEDPFWQNRRLLFADVERVAPEGARLMLSALTRALDHIAQHYGVASPLYADVLDLVGWRSGMHMGVHADNTYDDGRPHPHAHRAYSGLLYLNDDYEGGGLFLPEQDILVQPRRGMFISLPAGPSHTHGVLRVEAGTRITLPFFLTFDRSKAEPRVHGATALA